MKDALLEIQEKKIRALNIDLAWEHSQHLDEIYRNCSECIRQSTSFFETANRDALKGLDSRTNEEVFEDEIISPNPFD